MHLSLHELLSLCDDSLENDSKFFELYPRVCMSVYPCVYPCVCVSVCDDSLEIRLSFGKIFSGAFDGEFFETSSDRSFEEAVSSDHTVNVGTFVVCNHKFEIAKLNLNKTKFK